MNIFTVPAPSFTHISYHKVLFFMVSNNPQDYRPCINPRVRALRKSLREMRHGRHTFENYTDLQRGILNLRMPVVIGPVVEVIA